MLEKLRKTRAYPALLRLYLTLHKCLLWCCWQLFSLCPIQKNKIVFSHFNGGSFSDNPRYIAEELIRRGLPLKLYWVSAQPGASFPPELQTIRPDSVPFVWHMSTAGVWVDSTRKLYYFKKRKQQTYIQTWHAGPGLKKVEGDAGDSLSAAYIAYAKRDSRHIDLLLSNCRFYTELFRRAFWYDGAFLEKGIPKNDLYFRDPAALRAQVRKTLGLPQDVRLALYVPTWREDRLVNVYHLDFDGCLDAFEKRFGGTWIMLVRMHPNVNPDDFDIRYTDRIINASRYENVQELLAAGDAVITDYSSCGFDYIQLLRPSFLYAEDYEEMKQKGYYFDLEELPTPVAFTNEKMIRNILEFSEEEYHRKCTNFNERLGFYDDGHASEAVADYILKRIL